jgi:hypothetical protein
MGRKRTYDREAIIEIICKRMSMGEPLLRILKDEGMPSLESVTKWREQDKDIATKVARARDEGYDALAVQCLEIMDEEPERVPTTGAKDSAHVQWQKARVETRLKLLACWDPRKYGNKVDVTSGGNPVPAPTIVMPKKE